MGWLNELDTGTGTIRLCGLARVGVSLTVSVGFNILLLS